MIRVFERLRRGFHLNACKMSSNETEDFEHCIINYKSGFNLDLLKNKTAFITGGGSGIGFTIAEVLMRHGCDTVIASRNLSKLQQSAQKLQDATGYKCLPVQMDVRKPEDVIAGVDLALQQYPKIDILINSAAGNFVCPFDGMSYNAFKTVVDIDTLGTFNVCKTVYDKCMKKSGGVIISISATLYYRGVFAQAHAGSAKAAIDALMRHLAVELGSQNIRVLGVAPGPIRDTVGWAKLRSIAGMGDVEKQIPLGRVGTKREIAESVLFLASDLASFITGTCLVVDGGQWLTNFNPSKL